MPATLIQPTEVFESFSTRLYRALTSCVQNRQHVLLELTGSLAGMISTSVAFFGHAS